MKKIITLILASVLLFTNQTTVHANNTMNLETLPISAATDGYRTIIYTDKDITISESTTFEVNNYRTQTYSTKSTKKYVYPSRKYTISNSSGILLATFTLNATFAYDGKTATCTKTSYSTSTKNKNASFTSTSSSKSGSTATGKFTLKIRSTGKSISRTFSLRCSKNGVIS